MKKRSLLQKISIAFAVLSYLCAAGSVYFSQVYLAELGGDHAVTASFFAAIVFFVGVGIVLQVMGTANLPNLSFSSDD